MVRMNWERDNKAKKMQRRGIDTSPALLTLPAKGRSKGVKAAKVSSSKKLIPMNIKKRSQVPVSLSYAAAIRKHEERKTRDDQRREDLKKRRIRQETGKKLAAERTADLTYQTEIKRKVAARLEKRMAKVVIERRLQSGRTIVVRGVPIPAVAGTLALSSKQGNSDP